MNDSSVVKEKKKVGAVLVIGGGIAGIQASIDLAESGQKVYLLESSPAIGGVMASLDKTFPTNDCSTCILSPKLVEAGRHLNIELITYADLESVEGEAGNFKVKIKKRPKFVDPEKCTACGLCGKVDMPKPEELFEYEGELWVERIKIDEAACVQCGDCERACVAENKEENAMSSVRSGLLKDNGKTNGKKKTGATEVNRVLSMTPEGRIEYWQHHMSKCIKCYGCRDICPVFDEEKCRLEDWSQPGVLPPDAPMYHAARAYYIAERCTHCGYCEDTCPSHLPLRALVDLIRHEEPDKLFSYIPDVTEEQVNSLRTAFPQEVEEMAEVES